MATRKAIQVKYDPQTKVLPPPVQNNFPGAKASLPHRGWWPDTATVSVDDGDTTKKTFIFGDFMFVTGINEIGGVNLAPTGRYAVLRLSTGQLDQTTFFPDFGNTSVQSFEFDGRFLYVGGNFSSVDGVTKANGEDIAGLVRFDFQAGGQLDDTWNPEPFFGFGTDITVMEFNDLKNTLYIAGALATVQGTARANMAEVNLDDSGTPTAWDPAPSVAPEDIKFDSALAQVYIAGVFSSVYSDATVPRLARLNTAGAGSVDATWKPAPNAITRTIHLEGTRIFVGGDFTSIGSTPTARNSVAEIDGAGAVTSFDPDVTNTATVSVFDLDKVTEETLSVSGTFKDYLVIAGRFDDVGGTARKSIAAVDITTAVAHEWDPNPGNPAVGTNQIFGLAVKNRTVYATGNYNGISLSSNHDISGVQFPIFSDLNSKFSATTGDDAGAGTRADPFLTIDKALTSLGGAFVYAVVLDSGIYEERLDANIPADSTLIADLGQAPTITQRIGAKDGTYGARVSGRTKFYTGSASNILHVRTDGNDGTAVKGDPDLPWEDPSVAVNAMLDGDCVQIDDSGTYLYADDFNAAFAEITIQAKAGETPIFQRNMGGGQFQFVNTTVTQIVNFFGLTIITGIDDITPDARSFKALGPSNIFDCTFLAGSESIEDQTTGAGKIVVENCLFKNNFRTSIDVEHEADIKNCYFLNCGGEEQAPHDSTIFLARTGNGSTIDHCTFENSGGFNGKTWAAIVAERDDTSSSFDDLITFCDFLDSSGELINCRGIEVRKDATSPVGGNVDMDDCRFTDIGRQAIFGNFPKNGDFRYQAHRCLATRCQKRAETNEATYEFINKNFIRDVELVSIGSGGHGFRMTRDLTATNGNLFRWVSISSVGDGFLIEPDDPPDEQANTWLWRGIVEAGSGGNSIKYANQWLAAIIDRFAQSIFEKDEAFDIWDIRLASTFLKTDPKVISTVPEAENAAYFAGSEAILTGNREQSQSMGWTTSLVNITNGNLIMEGFNITGPANMYNGVEVAFGLTEHVDVRSCTFTELGQQGLLLGSSSNATNCLFENRGIGIVIGEASASVSRCVGNGCGSAFIVATGNHLVIKNNTGYLCDFGQFDRLGSGFDENKNNVYAGNGQADYSGASAMSNSLVENLAGSATIVNGTRLNPLYRDAGTPDLRLQTIDSGFFFDSPAKDLGDDGKDAGAFDVEHGTSSKAFILVDFEKDLGGGKIYRNPTFLVRKTAALKIREGETHGGVTYSEASAFKREHVLQWGSNTDMPAEQVADLEAIFTAGDGECQLSLDGGATFIPVRIIRSAGFEFTELEDATYSDDGLPTPVTEMVFRDSD